MFISFSLYCMQARSKERIKIEFARVNQNLFTGYWNFSKFSTKRDEKVASVFLKTTFNSTLTHILIYKMITQKRIIERSKN